MTRPMRVRVAYANYTVGDTIYPNGLYRDELLQRGLIEHVVSESKPTVEKPVPKKRTKQRGRGKAVERQAMTAGETRE